MSGNEPSVPPTGKRARPLFDPPIVRRALGDAFRKLDPRAEAKNPVMFVVWVGSLITTIIFLASLVPSLGVPMGGWERAFTGQIALWLWFTVLFANFAEAIAEGRGKAQADELRKTRTTTRAKRQGKNGQIEEVAAPDLRKGDIVVCEIGDVIPSDGTIIEGIASVDESAITGESGSRKLNASRSAPAARVSSRSSAIISPRKKTRGRPLNPSAYPARRLPYPPAVALHRAKARHMPRRRAGHPDRIEIPCPSPPKPPRRRPGQPTS